MPLLTRVSPAQVAAVIDGGMQTPNGEVPVKVLHVTEPVSGHIFELVFTHDQWEVLHRATSPVRVARGIPDQDVNPEAVGQSLLDKAMGR
jgi:hypothetical protein